MPNKKTTARTRPNAVFVYVGSLIVLLVVVGAVLNLLDLRVRKTSTQTNSHAFNGTELDVTNVSNGSVDVTNGAAGKVTVTQTVTEGIRKLRTTEQTNGNVFTVQEGGACNSGITLGLFGNCTVHYHIVVPINTTVVAKADNTSITITGVNGSHRLQTDNGDITIRNLTASDITTSTNNGDVIASGVRASSVDAQASNGDLKLQLLGSPSKLVAHSNNGAVTIRLQDTATAYKTVATSSNGKAIVTIKTDPDNTKNVINASSENGDVSLSY